MSCRPFFVIGYSFADGWFDPALHHAGLSSSRIRDAVQTRDLWTFRRQIGSRDPNWLLIETDEEE